MSDRVKSVADWQHQLDRQFPQGAIAHWVREKPGTYLIPRIYVVGMEDGQPVVWLPVFAGSDKELGPWAITSYDPDLVGPFGARVTLQGPGHAMLWRAGLDDKLAAEMQPERDEGIRRCPDGGPGVLNG